MQVWLVAKGFSEIFICYFLILEWESRVVSGMDLNVILLGSLDHDELGCNGRPVPGRLTFVIVGQGFKDLLVGLPVAWDAATFRPLETHGPVQRRPGTILRDHESMRAGLNWAASSLGRRLDHRWPVRAIADWTATFIPPAAKVGRAPGVSHVLGRAWARDGIPDILQSQAYLAFRRVFRLHPRNLLGGESLQRPPEEVLPHASVALIIICRVARDLNHIHEAVVGALLPIVAHCCFKVAQVDGLIEHPLIRDVCVMSRATGGDSCALDDDEVLRKGIVKDMLLDPYTMALVNNNSVQYLPLFSSANGVVDNADLGSCAFNSLFSVAAAVDEYVARGYQRGNIFIVSARGGLIEACIGLGARVIELSDVDADEGHSRLRAYQTTDINRRVQAGRVHGHRPWFLHVGESNLGAAWGVAWRPQSEPVPSFSLPDPPNDDPQDKRRLSASCVRLRELWARSDLYAYAPDPIPRNVPYESVGVVRVIDVGLPRQWPPGPHTGNMMVVQFGS